MKENILKQDKVASTISIINQYLRMALHQVQIKNPKFLYFIFKGNTVEKIIDTITVRNAKSALVIDDLGLQIVNRLLQEGITDITLCLTRFPKELMTTVKYIIQNSFPSIKINIIHYEEISMIQNIDLIISNPVYGKIGADITYNVKDLNYKEFINLLPANDYKRNSDKNLFNFQSDMIPVNDGFEDAVVTTHLARIHPTAVANMTLDEFERSQYIDPQLDKYFAENSRKQNIYVYTTSCTKKEYLLNADFSKVFITTCRDGANRHLPYSKTCMTYLLNTQNNASTVSNNELSKAAHNICCLEFDSSTKKKNLVAFVYSNNGFRFISKIFTAMNKDGGGDMTNMFPKVDWTRAWTVEEILADYGYTADEIAEVMADLVNFKGMEN